MKKSLRIIAALSIAFAFVILFQSVFIIDARLIKEIPVNMKTGKVIGFDVNSTALTFGRIPSGSTSTREIMITNDKNRQVKIVLKAEGDAAPFIGFEENNFILQPSEAKKIEVYATPPSSSQDEYDGTLKVYSLRNE